MTGGIKGIFIVGYEYKHYRCIYIYIYIYIHTYIHGKYITNIYNKYPKGSELIVKISKKYILFQRKAR